MNKDQLVVKRAFQAKKIWIGILIGLSVSGYMLFDALQEAHFVRVESGTGNYAWVDLDKNGQLDTSDPKEFLRTPSGNYNRESLSDVFGKISWNYRAFGFLIIALIFAAGRDLFYMIRIRLLTHKALSWRATFRTIFLWEFASALSPGVVGGAAVAMFILRKEGVNLGKSTAIVFITTMLDNLFYIILVPIFILFLGGHLLFSADLKFGNQIQAAFWIGYSGMLVACVFLFVSVFIFPNWSGKLIRLFFRLPVLKRWYEQANKTAEDIVLASNLFKKETLRLWANVFLATCASWMSRFLVVNCLVSAFISLSQLEQLVLFGKQLIMWLFLIVTPTPGGSGMAEFAFGKLLGAFGESAILITCLALLWRLITYFPYLIIGAVILPTWLRKHHSTK